jgi:hypothetical protein
MLLATDPDCFTIQADFGAVRKVFVVILMPLCGRRISQIDQ